MEYTHIQKYITTSPRKLRLVADMIRNLSPESALEALQFTNKAAAQPLTKAIKTSLANVSKEGLTFKKIEVNEGPKLKRFRAQARGRVAPYKRRWSHIKIVLTDERISNKKQDTGKKGKKGVSENPVVLDDSAVKTESASQAMTESSK